MRWENGVFCSWLNWSSLPFCQLSLTYTLKRKWYVWLLTCTSWWGIEKRSVSACVGNTDSPCEGETCFKWENPDLEASKKHDPGPKSWKTRACKFQKNNSEVLQSRGQQCRNEAFEWTFDCSHGEEKSVYICARKWIGEIFMLNESCWFWTGGVSFLLVKLERKYCIYRWNS